MARRLTRRQILSRLALAGVVVGGGAAVLPAGLFESDPPEVEPAIAAIEALVRGHFSYLSIDREGLRHFAEDYRDRLLDHPGHRDPAQILRIFLCSSDFFAHGADEARVVTYTTLYEPYLSPCYNPFAPT